MGCHEDANAPRDASATPTVVVDADIVVAPEAGMTDAASANNASFADASLVDMVTDAIALLDQIGNIIGANINDCEVMATRLDAFRLQHLDGVAEVSAIYDPEHKKELHELQPQFRARFKSAWAKVRPGVKKCAHGARMKQVIHDLWGDSDFGPLPDGGP